MKICIFSGSRSEYGLLKKLIFLLKKDNFFNYKLIISGSHLSKKYGDTINEILNDRIKIDAKIKVNLKKSSSWDVGNSFSLINKKVNDYFKKNNFDLLLVLGDRYETLAVVIAAYISGIKICHIHGGEKTLDSLDDNFRHSISKFSHYHFVSHEKNKKRLIQLGEIKNNIFVVGGLGANNIKNFSFFDKIEIENMLKLDLKKKIILVNYYPEISNKKKTQKKLDNILKVAKYFKNFLFVFTLPSHDKGNDFFIKKIFKFKKTNKNLLVFKSLGQKKYYSLMKYSNLMIGNSSSGILEMPSFSKFTLNIGDRQRGRLFSKSVIQTSSNVNIIKKNIIKYIDKKSKTKNIYFKKNTYETIVKNLKIIRKKKDNNLKEFIDL
jgi:GDP/UDP-N,N'-diacetylbacillosamine 2-epimerase (hydrolysing)